MIPLSEIAAAGARIAPHIRRTPVIEVDGSSLKWREPVTLKLELMQHTGSFKPRGAFNNLISRDIPAAGVVAASGGNHGAAVAFAAAHLGIPAQIFVPRIAGPEKIALIERAGADLVVTEGAYAEALTAAERYGAETGAAQIHAYDAPETLAGQGTLGHELRIQAPEIETLFVAVGGGGLIGGVASAFAADIRGGRVRLIAVEPERAATLASALASGPETEVDVGGIAASALGARRIGRLAYDIVRELGIEVLLVSDDEIAAAQSILWAACRVAAEPAGAAALAALLSGRAGPAPRPAAIVCGGNFPLRSLASR